MQPIYLDHAATTPMHPQVVEAMLPVYNQVFGNPSSIHYFGRQARSFLDDARQSIAKNIGAKPKEIVFTSGGTEADNIALVGVALARQSEGKHIITTQVEHHAILHTCKYLESIGFEVTYLKVDQYGQIDLNDLAEALRQDTILVSIMFGNNEVGTVQPIKAISQLLTSKGVLFHSDAVQAFGTTHIDLQTVPMDLMSITAHKINGPKGIGFLYIRDGISIVPQLHGGEQERKRRAGTENVAAIIGFQKAVEITASSIETRTEKYQSFRKILLNKLNDLSVNYELNGHPTDYLPHIVNIFFPGTHVESLLANLDLAGIAVSSGSACTAGSIEPSHVLTAMHGSESERAKGSVRISFGLNNTEEDVNHAAETIAKVVKRLISL